MKCVVAVLDTMWDWSGMTSDAGYRAAPRYFRINPDNHSGKRLYKLVGPAARLLVTNACRELATSAKGHGAPDPEWLNQNLALLDGKDVFVGGGEFLRLDVVDPVPRGRIDVLLICGKVAQSTYHACNFEPTRARVIETLHPAARTWSKKMIEDVAAQIQSTLHGETPCQT